MELNIRLRQLRRQRNAAGALAVLLVLSGLGLTLPRSVTRYRALRSAQAELIELQLELTRAQGRIVEEQKQIVELQRQITTLRGK